LIEGIVWSRKLQAPDAQTPFQKSERVLLPGWLSRKVLWLKQFSMVLSGKNKAREGSSFYLKHAGGMLGHFNLTNKFS